MSDGAEASRSDHVFHLLIGNGPVPRISLEVYLFRRRDV